MVFKVSDEDVVKVEELLAQNKLSQRKIAKKVGVSRGTVSLIAKGRRDIRPVLKRVAGSDFDGTNVKFNKVHLYKCPMFCNRMIDSNPCVSCMGEIKKRVTEQRERDGVPPLSKRDRVMEELQEYRRIEAVRIG